MLQNTKSPKVVTMVLFVVFTRKELQWIISKYGYYWSMNATFYLEQRRWHNRYQYYVNYVLFRTTTMKQPISILRQFFEPLVEELSVNTSESQTALLV